MTKKNPNYEKACKDALDAIKAAINVDGGVSPYDFATVLSIMLEGFLRSLDASGFPKDQMPGIANKLTLSIMTGMGIDIDLLDQTSSADHTGTVN